MAKLWAHISDPPPWALDAAPDTPRVLAEVAQRAMEKDPDDRFENAGEMGRQALAAVPGFGDTGARARLAAGEPATGRRWGPGRRCVLAGEPPLARAAPARLRGRGAGGSVRIHLMRRAAPLALASRQQPPGGVRRGRWARMKGAEGSNALTGAQGEVGEIVSEPIPVGDSPADVAVGEGAVWVANEGGETVTRIDPVPARQGGRSGSARIHRRSRSAPAPSGWRTSATAP